MLIFLSFLNVQCYYALNSDVNLSTWKGGNYLKYVSRSWRKYHIQLMLIKVWDLLQDVSLNTPTVSQCHYFTMRGYELSHTTQPKFCVQTAKRIPNMALTGSTLEESATTSPLIWRTGQRVEMPASPAEVTWSSLRLKRSRYVSIDSL